MNAMERTPNGWTIIDNEAGVLAYEYSFAPGAKANGFAARTQDGKMVVVSPPTRLSDGAYDEIAEFGDVVALAAPNGFHHLGLAAWKTRFPEARVFADPLATKRIQKKNRDAPDMEPIEGLAALLSDNIIYTAAPATKCGESWVAAKTKNGWAWYASDILSNFESMPKNFAVRMLFKLTGSKPGYNVFHTAMKFIVADRKRVLRQMIEEATERAPSVMVPGHGPILDAPDLADQTRTLLAEATR